MPVRPPCFDLNGCRRAPARTHTCGKVSHVRSRWRGTDNSKKDRSPSSAPREVRAPSIRCVGGEITWSAGQFADTEGWFLFFFNFFFPFLFRLRRGMTWRGPPWSVYSLTRIFQAIIWDSLYWNDLFLTISFFFEYEINNMEYVTSIISLLGVVFWKLSIKESKRKDWNYFLDFNYKKKYIIS